MDETRIRPQEIDGFAQAEPPAAFEPDAARNDRMEAALEQLRTEHLPFRRAAPDTFRELEDLRMAVIEQVTSEPGLAGYYEEAWTGVRAEGAIPLMALRRVVHMQLQLMQQAFSVLQLHRYGNAPENTGWVDLFRRWGASPRFNQVFDEVDRTLTPDFVTFYLTYLRASLPRITSTERLWDENRASQPLIQHPWLERDTDRGRGVFMDSGLVEARLEFVMPPGAGGVIDPKGSPEADQMYEISPADPDADASSSKESGNE